MGVLFSCATRTGAAFQSSPAEVAARTLAQDVETRQSVEMRLRTEMTIRDGAVPEAQQADFILDHYIETAAGQRRLDMRMFKSDAVIGRSLALGDGKRFMQISFDPQNSEIQTNVFVTRQFWMEDQSDRRQAPQPLLYLYVGREPLHKALPNAAHLGTETVLGRECDRFLFNRVRWMVPQDQVFTLDRLTGIPLKVEGFRNATARENERPMWTWTAGSLDQVQGRHVPLKSTQIAYGADGATLSTSTYLVESIEFDKDFPPSTFQVKIQPGVNVFDSFTKKATTKPGVNPLAKTNPTPAATSAKPPIEAIQPKSWSPLVSGVSFAVGGAVLLAAGLMWRRRR